MESGCELEDAVLQECPQADLVRQEMLPGLLEESCRLRGRLTQSPSGGLWHTGSFDEVRYVVDAAKELLELWGLAPRRCPHADLQPGQLRLTLADDV
jgi:hypothetical protein